jgi:hypothetical protein
VGAAIAAAVAVLLQVEVVTVGSAVSASPHVKVEVVAAVTVMEVLGWDLPEV